MSPPKHRWQQLCDEINAARQNPAHSVTELQTSILRRLKKLADKGICAPHAIGWIQKIDGKDRRAQITFKKAADGHDNRGHPAVCLSGLTYLDDGAILTVSIELDCRRSVVLSYSLSIQGTARDPSAAGPVRSWYARIDLTENPEGQGVCGHPLLHCHIGDDPEAEDRISPRVPLPWLAPGDALDWLLATVEPSLEPVGA